MCNSGQTNFIMPSEHERHLAEWGSLKSNQIKIKRVMVINVSYLQ